MAPPRCFKPKPQWQFPQGPPETSTTYKLSYLQNDINGYRPPDLIKPESEFKLYDFDDYMDLNTVYRNSFQTNQPVERPTPIRHQSNLGYSRERPESCTVYKLSYLQHDGSNARPAPIRPTPNLNWKSTAPLETSTTQKDTYVEQPFCKSEPIKRRESNIKPTGRMDCGTVYNLSYVPLPTERRQSFRPVTQYQRPAGEVDTNTTYNMSYVPTSVDERPMPIRPNSDFTLFGNQHLGFDTIYKNSYRNVGMAERPAPIRHQNNLGGSKERPVSDTVYKLSYVPCTGFERSTPIRPEENIISNMNAPFQSLTTTKHDYVPLPYCRSEPIQHRESHIRSEGPVEKGTVYKLSYMPVQSELRRPFKPVNQYEAPKGKVDTGTTYNMSFVPNEFSFARPDIIRPYSDFKLFGDGDTGTDFNTIYRNSYHPITAKRSAPIRHMDNLKLNSGNVESSTVYKLSYVPNNYRFERPQPIKPTENDWRTDEPFEGCTTTQLSFTPHPIVRTQPIPRRQSQIQWTGPVEKKTVYNMSYMPVRGELTRPIVPKSQYERPSEPIEINTTYKNTFVPHAVPDREFMPWACRSNWQRPTVPMETETIQRLSYQTPCAVEA